MVMVGGAVQYGNGEGVAELFRQIDTLVQFFNDNGGETTVEYSTLDKFVNAV